MQEVSALYTSLFSATDELKMALRARKVAGTFEKRAPDLSSESCQRVDRPWERWLFLKDEAREFAG